MPRHPLPKRNGARCACRCACRSVAGGALGNPNRCRLVREGGRGGKGATKSLQSSPLSVDCYAIDGLRSRAPQTLRILSIRAGLPHYNPDLMGMERPKNLPAVAALRLFDVRCLRSRSHGVLYTPKAREIRTRSCATMRPARTHSAATPPHFTRAYLPHLQKSHEISVRASIRCTTVLLSLADARCVRRTSRSPRDMPSACLRRQAARSASVALIRGLYRVRSPFCVVSAFAQATGDRCGDAADISADHPDVVCDLSYRRR